MKFPHWLLPENYHIPFKKEDSDTKLKDAIMKEADILRIEHPNARCRFFADSVFKYLKQEEK